MKANRIANCRGVALFLGALLLVPGAARAAENASAAAELDFQQASGIAPSTLERALDRALRENGTPSVPLSITLFNERDECLLRGEVVFVWKGGEEKVAVQPSGLIVLALSKPRLDGLKIRAPAGFVRLRQFSFPQGPAYQSPARFDDYGVPIVSDGEIRETLLRQLTKLQREDKATNCDTLRDQLQRKRHPLKLPAPASERLAPDELYRRCCPATVVMGTLARSGQLVLASGVVIHGSGIVATNYHVMNKQASSVAVIGVMTYDRKVYPVREVLAGDQAHDVAIVRIDAKDLPAATLSLGEQPGAPVTVIAHPAERFYYLTQGHVARYSTWLNCGRNMASMSITADFCPGSSGGPVFAANGSVAGIVASVKDLGHGMVDKQCVPAQAIRALLNEAASSAGHAE